MAVAVSIRSICKSYDGRTRVLNGIDLEVAAGELFFLLGGSGCGKTTLLRTVAGFLTPDAGSVQFDARDVTRLPTEQRDIGMVFQNYALWPHLTVAENIAFGLDVRRVEKSEKTKRVDEALALVELSGYGARRIAELSGGQQQRVALARAIVVRPAVLLLDEPLSNLDARLRTAMRSEIRRVCKEAGVTALYVTHDQAEALSTADRIALMDRGRIAQVGTPRELYERPASRAVAEFVGEANLLPATVLTQGRVRTAAGELVTSLVPAALVVGADCTVCVRPERVRIGAGPNPLAAVLDGGSFLGASGHWRVRVGDTALTVHEAAPPLRAPGAALTLSIAPDDVVVLAS